MNRAPQQTSRRPRRWILAAVAAVNAGCVLADSAHNYPFVPELTPPGDAGVDLPVEDLPPVKPPRLVFTEVLLDAPESDFLLGDIGEYVEIRNVGAGPADPRSITLLLSGPNFATSRIEVATPFSREEHAAVTALQPIQPGDYFIFVRHEVTSVAPVAEIVGPGAVYDYGRFGAGPTLAHLVERTLEIGYRYPDNACDAPPCTDSFDSITWNVEGFWAAEIDQGMPIPIVEGQAIGVDEGFDTPDENNSTARWCNITDPIPAEPAPSAFGTPGSGTDCQR